MHCLFVLPLHFLHDNSSSVQHESLCRKIFSGSVVDVLEVETVGNGFDGLQARLQQ